MCPPCLQHGFFITAVIDNIDLNATSATARRHFHGTGISLFQHPDEAAQYKLSQYNLESRGRHSQNAELPEYYTDISPVAEVKQSCPVALINSTVGNVSHMPIKESNSWLQRVELLSKEER